MGLGAKIGNAAEKAGGTDMKLPATPRAMTA